ncbi:MAG: F0F1 ATP synthase subunit alpha, partial [Lachnospiraceae bacterium]|nr:F0F1 ATP synthase subunit alpha [Lachnospiraceae bacterium]
LAAFSQFGSDLDADTKEKLAQGERIREVLKQPQYRPMAVEKQIVIIYAATKKHLLDIEVSDIAEYEKVLFELIENQYPEIFQTIREQKVLTEEIEPKLVLAIEQAKEGFTTK